MVRFFGDFEFAGGVPSGPIHQHNRMGLSGDVAADLVEMHLHGLRVRPRQHERRPLAVSRTDGAEQIGVVIALIGRLAGGACPFSPTGASGRPCCINHRTSAEYPYP